MENKYIFIITLFFCFILCYFKKDKIIIPKIIHKIYIQDNGTIPEKLEKHIIDSHNSWLIHNPGYKIKYWSLNDCREYLKKNFSEEYIKTFDCIKPYACKSDFFRYCIIYNEGGWYSDWKQVCLKNNLLDKLSDKEFICFYDKGNNYVKKNQCIAQAFFGGIKNHPILKDCINNVIYNVNNKIYGNCGLDPTGPCLIGNIIKKYNIVINGEFNHLNNNDGDYFDNDLGNIIQHKCNKCSKGQDWKNGNNYNILWNKKKFYC